MKKTIFDIEFEATSNKTISSAMHVDDDKFTNMAKKMGDYFTEYAEEHENPSNTEMLASYLESKAFKKTGYRLEKPADYLMLGFAFNIILNNAKFSIKRIGGGITPQDLMHFLAHLMEE